MSALCRALTADDEAAMVEFLNQFPTSEYRPWEVLFRHGWNALDNVVGFGLFEGTRPVGYLGTIQKQRTINGATFRLVNLSTWFVLKDYRSQSLDPQRMVLEYSNCVSAGHTIIPQVVKRYESIGYRGYDYRIHLCFRTPFARTSIPDVEVHVGDETIERITHDQRELVEDHRSYSVVPFLFTSSTGDRCLVMCQRVIRRYKGRMIATTHCLHISNKSFYLEIERRIRDVITSHMKTWILAVDDRMVNRQKLSRSLMIPMITPRMSRNNIDFDPELLDNLYTELVLFKY